MNGEETNGNGRVTIREVYGLLEKVYARIDSVAAKGESNHKENLRAIKDLDCKLDEHLIDAGGRDTKIAALQEWRQELPKMMSLTFSALIAAEREKITKEHNVKHEDHLMKEHDDSKHDLRDPGDPPDSQFLETRESAFPKEADPELGDIRRVWRVGKWVVLVVASWAALLGLNTLANHNTMANQTKLLEEQNAQLAAQNKAIYDYLKMVDPEPSPITPTPTPSNN